MTEKRIYLVTNGDDTHLVEANNKTVAINHIARKRVSAHVATQLELIELVADGAKVEKVEKAGETVADNDDS